MRAYSLDLRQRVLAALDRGMSRQQVVVTFGISLATLKRWVALHRTHNGLTPKRAPGRGRMIKVEQHLALQTQLTAHPDATLERHAQLWNAAHGTTVSYRTLGRAITRLGWTRKKSHWVPPSAMSRHA